MTVTRVTYCTCHVCGMMVRAAQVADVPKDAHLVAMYAGACPACGTVAAVTFATPPKVQPVSVIPNLSKT